MTIVGNDAAMTAWKMRKHEQCNRVADRFRETMQHGIGPQFSTYGPQGSTYAITWSTGAVTLQTALIGQLGRQVRKRVGYTPNRTPIYADAREEEKPYQHRYIDLTDEQVDLLVSVWESGGSALELPFVPFVWDADGKRMVPSSRVQLQ